MVLLTVVLLLALVLGGAGFALHALWWIALVILIVTLAVVAVWLLGLAFRGEHFGTGGHRYRW
ncbi:hypothetical protein [Streptacidiphilus neutrinimicus]|uniref:hypothetical protein n=1 Tax=Streptacidiphilus neutrinimicus TaxID=105420 RepID=UPI0005AAFB28|nr:hypothetical protein [Streptacidiphilus neutrinimicus]